MTGHAGYGIMSRVRPTCSHQNLRSTWASEQAGHHKFATRPQRNKSVSSSTPSFTQHSRQRNHSVSHAAPSPPPRKMQDARGTGHWPPLEFDPLKLNPTVIEVDTTEKPPPRLYERDLLRTRSLRTKASHLEAVTVSAPRSRPRLHHSDSGISFDYDAYSSEQEFNFAEEKAKALQDLEQHATHTLKADQKGWPSPASSVDSGKSWFDLDDDDDDNEDAYDDSSDDDSVTDESEVEQEDKEVWTELSSPRRRPQVGSPDDPTNYLKRGAWKRRAIFFGQQSNEVYTKEEDAFDIDML